MANDNRVLDKSEGSNYFENEDSEVLLLFSFYKNTLFLLIVNLLEQHTFYSTTPKVYEYGFLME